MGYFRPKNIPLLTRFSVLEEIPEEELGEYLGEPERTPTGTTRIEDPSQPSYLIYPTGWDGIAPEFVTERVCIVDFGHSYEISSPSKPPGIPILYQSPELMLDSKIGNSTAGLVSDIWALACTLFEFRAG